MVGGSKKYCCELRNMQPELLTKDPEFYLTAYAHSVYLGAQRP